MPKQKISCAIIGLGFWGKKFLRKTQLSPVFDLQAVATAYVDSEIKNSIGGAEIFSSGRDLLLNRQFDLVFILNSVENHFSLSQLALKSSKNIFLTKPLTIHLKESLVLEKLAQTQKAKIFVDHTFLFNKDFNYLKKLCSLQKISSLTSERMQFGKFQKYSDVLGELLYHDLYMCQELMGHEMPIQVQAMGEKNFNAEFDQISLQLIYKNARSAQLFGAMNSIEKRKSLRVVTNKKLLSWQDMGPSIFTKADYKFGTSHIAKLKVQTLATPAQPKKDAIDLMLEHVAECVRQDKKSEIIDFKKGLEVMRLIEAARKSAQLKRSIRL
jgi:predicted dehydrogenase